MQITGKRVLVTGGAGFVGSHLVDRLAISNHVSVLDDFSVGTEENLAGTPAPVRIIRGDIRDRSTAEAAVKDADVVFHLAVVCLRSSISDPMASHLVNDLGTLNLLLAARQNALDRFVYVSSSEVYGSAVRVPMDEEHPLQPTTPYAAGKLAGEAYALSFHRTYGLPVTVVRPFNMYGPREHVAGASGEVIPRFVAQAMAGRALAVFGDGLQTRDFTWVEDSVRGIELAAECDDLVGGCVNIARGQEISVLKIAQLVLELVGSSAEIEHHPARPGDVRRHLAGVELARTKLGFSAETGIEDGLARYVEWASAQPRPRLPGDGREEVRNWQLAARVA